MLTVPRGHGTGIQSRYVPTHSLSQTPFFNPHITNTHNPDKSLLLPLWIILIYYP